MVNTTYFNKKDGGLSSIRTTIGDSKNKMSITSYPSTGKGGVTFSNKDSVSRINNRGQSLGTGLKGGSKMTYFGTDGKINNNLARF